MGGPLSKKRHEPKMDDADGVYISLIHAKAESYNLAFNLDADSNAMADLSERREELMRLASPHILIELCNAWKKLQDIYKEVEAAELEEMGE